MTLEEAIIRLEAEEKEYRQEANEQILGILSDGTKVIRDGTMMKYYKEQTAYVRGIADWLKLLKEITESGDCNNCLWKGKCDIEPKAGQMVRYNCYAYAKTEKR